MKVWFLTGNEGKVREAKKIFNQYNFQLEQMNLDLKELDTSTIKNPKIQETSTLKLLECFIYNKSNKFCNESAKKEMTSALNRRIVMPFYIPLIGLSSFCCNNLVIKSV